MYSDASEFAIVKKNYQLRSANPHRVLECVAALCIAVLLLSTFAQALDLCEFAQLRTSHQVCVDRSTQSAPRMCLICAAAHAASLPSPIASNVAPLRIDSFIGRGSETPPRVVQIFGLHVRPPPSL